ncbi:MAG TPA: sigma-70 family RNA polymerase sigma factor [Candidatus Limiplasma stercoravium]|nr:sigma-70 family RNA polymerase sigma factor [Candidatus Limiplasma stercoravium]
MDKAFFAEQIQENAELMWRVAHTVLRADEDCKDAMQETGLKAWMRRDTLRDESRFKAWLIRILINECHNVYRRQRRYVPLADQPEPSASPPDVDLYLTLMNLPSMDRILLELHYVERMSEKEIAQVYHLPASTIRGRIHRAKKKLRKELDV